MMKKRIISAFLTFVMTIVSVGIVMAEDTAQSIYAEDIKILKSLGFMKRISAEDENAGVTKGVFAAAIMDLIGAKAGTAETVSPFADVNSSTLYYREICLAAQYGVAHGDEMPNFEPESNITYTDAVVMLVNALGYHDYAKYNGGYPNGYLKIASEIGLNKNLNVGESTRLTAGMCARVLLNAGEAEIVNVLPYRNGYKVQKGDTLFWEKHNITKSTGILEANEFTHIDSADGAGENRVIIDGTVASVYYSNESYDYLGYNVEYYYRDNDGDLTVLYMQPRKTEVTVIDSEDINSYSDGVISYNIENRSKTMKIGKDTSVIYNGVYTNTYFIENEKSIFCPDNGEIKGIDNNGDGKIDVVSILHYENVIVSAVNKTDKVIFDKYRATYSLDFSKAEDENYSWILTNAAGVIVNFEELKERDVISVARSMDEKVVRGVLCATTVTGILKQVTDDYGKTVININGTEYASANANIKNIPAIGSTVTAYLDFLGKIADVVADSATSSAYAFVMRKYYDETEEEHVLKLLMADGIKKDYKLARTVRIDGETYKDAGLDTYMDSFADYQVILCKINTQEKITVIDTVKKDKGGNNDVLRSFQEDLTNLRYYSMVGSFAEKMITGGKTVIFKIPPKISNENPDAPQYDYTLYGVSSLPNVTDRDLTVRGYSSDPDSVIADCVLYVEGGGSSVMNESSPYMVVSKIEEVLNASDEPIIQFTGYNYSGEVSYALSETYTYDKLDEIAINAHEVKVGDVIKFSLDARGEISYMSPLHVKGTVGLGAYATKYPSWYSHSGYWAYMGWLLAREDMVLAFVNNKDSLATAEVPDALLKMTNNTKIYYVSQKRKTTVEEIDLTNLGVMTDYRRTFREQQVLAIAGGGPVKVLVVYE